MSRGKQADSILYGRRRLLTKEIISDKTPINDLVNSSIFQEHTIDPQYLSLQTHFCRSTPDYQKIFATRKWYVLTRRSLPVQWQIGKPTPSTQASRLADIIVEHEIVHPGSLSMSPCVLSPGGKSGKISKPYNHNDILFRTDAIAAVEQYADKGDWFLLDNPKQIANKEYNIAVYWGDILTGLIIDIDPSRP